MSVVINGTIGIDTIQASSIPNSSVTSAKIVDGTIADSDLGLSVKPCFSAYRSTNQSITSATWTKIAFDTKEFDTTTAYDNVTNYRFQPTKAGYYNVTSCYNCIGTALTRTINSIYKNGSEFKRGCDNNATTATNSMVTATIYLNGSTDYLESFGYITGTAPGFNGGVNYTYFQAFYIGA
jgi:hypothetical protein